MALYTPLQLHDLATRGEQLTADEQAALAQWYSEQDHAESQVLPTVAPRSNVAEIHIQLDAAVRQLSVTSQHIEDMMRINEGIRRDIVQLHAQLARRSLDHAA